VLATSPSPVCGWRDVEYQHAAAHVPIRAPQGVTDTHGRVQHYMGVVLNLKAVSTRPPLPEFFAINAVEDQPAIFVELQIPRQPFVSGTRIADVLAPFNVDNHVAIVLQCELGLPVRRVKRLPDKQGGTPLPKALHTRLPPSPLPPRCQYSVHGNGEKCRQRGESDDQQNDEPEMRFAPQWCRRSRQEPNGQGRAHAGNTHEGRYDLPAPINHLARLPGQRSA